MASQCSFVIIRLTYDVSICYSLNEEQTSLILTQSLVGLENCTCVCVFHFIAPSLLCINLRMKLKFEFPNLLKCVQK